MITSKQRAYLRGQAQHMDTIFQIGKLGVGAETIEGVENALRVRELIKLRVLDNCGYSAKEAANTIAENIEDCIVVQVIGSRFVLFLQNKKETKYDIKSIK